MKSEKLGKLLYCSVVVVIVRQIEDRISFREEELGRYSIDRIFIGGGVIEASYKRVVSY